MSDLFNLSDLSPAPPSSAWQRWKAASFGGARPQASGNAATTANDHASDRAKPAARAARGLGPRDDAVPQASTPAAPAQAPPQEIDLRQVLDQWRRQAEQEGYQAGLRQGVEEGHRQGLATGHEAGLAAARVEMAGDKEALAALFAQGSLAIESLHETLGQATIALALDIARDLVRAELSRTPQALLPLVEDVLRAEGGAPLRLWLHPDDLALVQRHLEPRPEAAQYQLLADPALARGGFRAQSAHGDIDATLHARWRQLSGALGCDKTWEEE